MFGRYKYWLPYKVINLGIALLPKEFQTETLIKSSIKSGHIKVTRNVKITQKESEQS
jgi:hypothetical protein